MNPRMDILEAVQRRAVNITTPEELKERLAPGQQLRIKYGIDPTNPNIHLGHTVPLRLLRRFQDAGHKAIIILGDYTASLGDPTGRDQMREGMGLAEARANSVKYIEQLRRLINMDVGKCEIHYNSNWLQYYTTGEWLSRMKQWTVQQILDRDDFKKRMTGGSGIHLNELLYPLFQGEDSVRVRADVELGGSEQLFTLLVGREMQKQAGQKPQTCITLPILRGTDGERRMGKSLGNFIGVNEDPFEMFSKVMSIPDYLIREWTALLTDRILIPPGVASLRAAIKEVEYREKVLAGENPPDPDDFNGVGPMAAKKILAHDIVNWLHKKEAADKAHDRWHKQFTMRECPDEIPVVTVSGFTQRALFLLLSEMGLAPSKNKARTLVEQGAVTVNGNKVTDPTQEIVVTNNPTIKCGRKYMRLKWEEK